MGSVRETPLFVICLYGHFDMKIGDECHQYGENIHDITSNKSLFMTATKKVVNTTNDNEVFSMDDENSWKMYFFF